MTGSGRPTLDEVVTARPESASGDLLDVARAAASAGAAVALRWAGQSGRLEIAEKAGPDDLVSQADREAEIAIAAVLAERRPQDALMGEEHGSRPGTSGVQWYVDPIDGTTNYLYRRPDWAVSVAAADESGRVLAAVVAEPALDLVTEAHVGGGTWTARQQVRRQARGSACSELERALVELNLGTPRQRHQAGRLVDALVPHVRDVRRGGSAASALAQVAAGRADAAWVPGLSPWDCAAGVLLVSEAGLVVGDLAGPTPGRIPDSGDVLAAPREFWEALRALLAPVYAGQG